MLNFSVLKPDSRGQIGTVGHLSLRLKKSTIFFIINFCLKFEIFLDFGETEF